MESISRGFVYAAIVYVFALAYGLNFIFSAIKFGLVSWDFLLVVLIILLPILLSFAYILRFRLHLGQRDILLRRLIIVSMIIAVALILFVIVPVSY